MIMKESSVKRKSHLDILENVSCMVTSMRLFEICRGRTRTRTRTWILYNQEVTQLRDIYFLLSELMKIRCFVF
jgi:hypothetical protein